MSPMYKSIPEDIYHKIERNIMALPYADYPAAKKLADIITRDLEQIDSFHKACNDHSDAYPLFMHTVPVFAKRISEGTDVETGRKVIQDLLDNLVESGRKIESCVELGAKENQP